MKTINLAIASDIAGGTSPADYPRNLMLFDPANRNRTWPPEPITCPTELPIESVEL
jgi:hypothetical protein